MKNQGNSWVEKRHYQSKAASDIIQIPPNFRREALSITKHPELLKAPIIALRIVFKALNDCSYDQFLITKQPEQLSLFSEEFETKSNTSARFTFHITDVDKHKDQKRVIAALTFLESLHKTWHKAKNDKGVLVRTQFGLITNPALTDNKITFLMHNFWLERLLAMPYYNTAYYQLAWEFKDVRHLLLYLWIIELKPEGTEVSFTKFQEDMGYNYAELKEFTRNVLGRIKKILDKSGNVSFNYSVKGTNIAIVPYVIVNPVIGKLEITITKQKVYQKVNYWKIRHELSTEQTERLRTVIFQDIVSLHLFIRSYKSFVANCRKNKKNADTYQGKEFLIMFQEFIIKVYRSSAWGKGKLREAYPKIL